MSARKIKNITNLILLALLLLFSIAFSVNEILPYKLIASSCFVISGIVNIDWKSPLSKKYPFILIAGLIFALAGDVGIFFSFVAGAACFAIGHILYIISYFCLYKYQKSDLKYVLFVFIASFFIVVINPVIEYSNSAMFMVCLVYSIIISIMCAKAISSYMSTKTSLALVILIGAVLFYLSDIMVLCDSFAVVNSEPFRFIGRSWYFPGQFILAQSITKYYEQ